MALKKAMFFWNLDSCLGTKFVITGGEWFAGQPFHLVHMLTNVTSITSLNLNTSPSQWIQARNIHNYAYRVARNSNRNERLP